MRCFFSPAPPRFVSRLESACLIEGEDIQFSCSTFTTPLPRIRYGSAELTAAVALRFCNYCVSECSAACSWQVVEGWQRVDWAAEILDYEWCTERDPVSHCRQGNWSRYWAVRVWGIIVHVWTQLVSLISELSLWDNVWKCFILFSFGMNLVASSARQVYAPPMSPRLTARMTNHRTSLLKVWQSEPMKLISST